MKAEGIHLREVILFGSYARGKPHRWSDIDVALIADEFSGVGFEDVGKFIKIAIKKKYDNIQTVTFSTDYFEKGDPFIDEIMRTGIRIEV